MHRLIHQRNSRMFYQILEILRRLLRKTKLPSFSIVKYFCNKLELTSTRDKIQLYQLIQERNSRIFYNLLEILTPRLWERSCYRSPSKIFLQPSWINFKKRQNAIASINSPWKFHLVLPTSCNINTFTPENEAAFIFHRQIFQQPTWINFKNTQNSIASIKSRKKFQIILPTSRNIKTLTPEKEAAIVNHRQIFLQPTWIVFRNTQNFIASINSRKKFQNILPTCGNINTLTLAAKLPSFSVVIPEIPDYSTQNILPASGNINTLTLGAKLPSFSVVKYFCNPLELTSKTDNIPLHQLIHESNSRLFYQLLEIFLQPTWIVLKNTQNFIASINSRKKFQIILPTSGNISATNLN